MVAPETRKLVTAEVVAEALVVQPTTIKLWGKTGFIPRYEIAPRIVRYDLDEVIATVKAKGGAP
jgi:hypothetical protein